MDIPKSRIVIVVILCAAILSVFLLRLVRLQLIDGAEYADQSKYRLVTKTEVDAPRGEILDRYCRVLVSNRTVYTVEFNKTLISDMNGTIARVIELFELGQDDYIDTFPVSADEPYFYTETVTASFRAYLERKKIDPDETAEAVVDALIRFYKLTDYDRSVARKILAVRYEIEMRSDTSFFTFAEGVSIETMTRIKEHAPDLPGVSVEVSSARVYSEDFFMSHLLGYVGRIYAEEYETLKTKGYAMNDTVGKAGVEKVCEDWLRGTDGYKYAQHDTTGSLLDVLENEEAQIGNDVILTVDKYMQALTEEGLSDTIAALRLQNGEDAAKSGAAVFQDVATGEILSMASSPNYNLSTYYEDYSILSKDASSPYMNRAISGLFPPGSTFKMISAIAGLEESVIRANTSYLCTGRYEYYDDYQPTCNESRVHGRLNVRSALQKSCNTFFYDIGRQLGADKLAEYARMFGFGSQTGIELAGEASGLVASKTYRESLGKTWQAGENLLAAIGQTDHLVTPIQLSNYVATIANYGVRMRPYLIRSVRDHETGEVLFETEPTVVDELEIADSTFDVVIEGMKSVAKSGGTANSAFSDFKITDVAVKTGTAEVGTGKHPTALLVGFAPADDPKIAFAVVIENGGRNATSALASLVKNVLSYYMSEETSEGNHGLLLK